MLLHALLQRLACLCGVHHLFRWLNRHKLLIVAYHGIAPNQSTLRQPWHLVRQRLFNEQLRYLIRHYDLVPLEHAIRALQSRTLRRPTACITFDDGYRSNYTLALPLLDQFQVPATVFLTTGLIGTDRTVWTVEMLLAFGSTAARQLDLSSFGLGPVTLQGRRHALRIARRAVEGAKQMPPQERTAAVHALSTQLALDKDVDAGPFRMMAWEDVAAMDRSAMVSFGAHTKTHQILATLDDAELKAEISDSIDAIKQRLASVVSIFAYPNGGVQDFDSRSIQALHDCGITAAVTTIEGLNGPGTDPFRLRRITIGSEVTSYQFKSQTSGLTSSLKRWLRRG
jgi:peptidoglycan/xylan/chitin deacetylase (PgdA/CDA1 family)